MRRRMMRALGLGMLVHILASCGTRALAQDPVDCEPVTAESVALVADRLSLDTEQRAWLEARRKAGDLEEPSDLASLPGAGPELLEELAGAFCWGESWDGEARANSRRSSGGVQSEIHAGLQKGTLTFRGRGRRSPDATATVRGGLAFRDSGWEVLLGHVRSRRALGLLLATPGAEPRGGPALAPAASGWGTSVSMDPDLPLGVVIGRRDETGSVRMAGLTTTASTGAGNGVWWGAGEWNRVLGETELGATLLPGPGGWAGNLWIHDPQGAADWTGEWAWGVSGTSQGAAWRIRGRTFRVRAGFSRRSASYHVPAVRRIHALHPDETLGFQTEVRWKPGPGRFLVFGFEDERRPNRPWMRFRTRRRLEWGERVVAGLGLALLWRSTVTETMDSREEEKKLRGEMSYTRGGWRLLLRLEEGSSASGRVGLRSLRIGRRGRLAWEIRADVVSETDSGPLVWVYRRRAGGVFGWDRRRPGSWLGGWIQYSWERLRLELSADEEAAGWEWTGAVQVPIGRLDRASPGP